jgi:hypothetical protein
LGILRGEFRDGDTVLVDEKNLELTFQRIETPAPGQ